MTARPESRPDLAEPEAPSPSATHTVSVRPVSGNSEMKSFLMLPWRIYQNDPAWVPPLLSDMKAVLSPSHPFHRHAEVQCFIAWRNNAAVGRIAAILNHTHIEFHEEQAGFFGLFECINDASVANALLTAAEQWLRARGMKIIRGPFNLSSNDELWSPGILIDGFQRPPSVMMAHNTPYYAGLVEAAGYTKSKDLLAYWIAEGHQPPPRLVRGVERIQQKEGVSIRPIDMKQLEREVDLIRSVYNSAWERNWGFVPMSTEEIAHMAKQLKPVVSPDLCIIAEIAGEPVGFGLALPDFNQAIRHANGRLFPFGLLKILWYKRKIDAGRTLTLGVKKGHRNKGIDAMIIVHLFREIARLGHPRGECSWILEDNWDMRRGLERIGGVVDKTYRVFEKPLD
jgi:hypothetical protein